MSTYDREIRALKRENKDLKRTLSYFEEFNQSNRKIIYSQSVDGNYLLASVAYSLDHFKRIKKLNFKVNDTFNHRRKDRLNFLNVEVYYNDEDANKLRTLNHLVIRDFLISPPNRGYGSFLLREALFHISQLFGENVKIIGKLSSVDEQDPENHARRDHVYQKFGFTIKKSQIYLDGIPLDKLAEERQKWNGGSSS
ncbi:hypothetical protein IHV24_05035 [Streptococcus agalactiae]|nr:hypothetical protein [Streptococcus agalactiae]